MNFVFFFLYYITRQGFSPDITAHTVSVANNNDPISKRFSILKYSYFWGNLLQHTLSIFEPEIEW